MNEKVIRSFKKELLSFLVYTFGIAWAAWGVDILLMGLGIVKEGSLIYWFFFVIGGNSPAIAELIREKKYRAHEEFKAFVRNCIKPVRSIWGYLYVTGYATFFGVVLYFAQQGGNALPIYMFIPLTIIMLFGGGTEEVGWRGLLQPLLEQKFSMLASSILVSVIWGFWHLPLWFIGATSQSQTNFGSFLIGTLAFSIALAVIRDMSKSIFMCILFHCMINAAFNVAGVVMGFKSNMITLVISLMIYLVYILRKRKQHGMSQSSVAGEYN
jgi:membrane protease YdiL (CAAX protease family)